jgi:futalosine hydrolase
MKLLIVSATDGEVAIAKKYIAEGGKTSHQVHMLTTGVGQIATTFALTKELCANQYDLVLQAGVGGSFDKNIPLGSLVKISAERYGDLGAEDHDEYLDIFSMGLIPVDEHPHSGGWLVAPASSLADRIDLPAAPGLTVSTVSGSERTIAMRMQQYGCQVESMEGAALHYTCLQLGVPFAQVRAISNYVIPRDKSQWQMKDAIINLNNWLIDFLSKG